MFDRHRQAELRADLETTLATMVEEPHLINLGSGTGGTGAAGVREFYATKLIGQFFPPDVEFIQISQTVDAEGLMDELVIRFTHSATLEQLLPGVAPTGRRGAMALVAIVGIKDGKVAYAHIDWDQAGLLAFTGKG